MSFQIEYKPLIDIKIHHDYFLDDGTDKFIDLSDEQKKTQLAEYRFLDYLSVVPTLKTQIQLRNHKIVLRHSNEGFHLFVNVEEYTKAGETAKVYCPKIQMEGELTLTFELRFSDPYFNNYTNDKDANENRYYYFTNTKPDGEPNSFPNFFDASDVHTKFLLKEKTSRELLYDIITKEVAPINDLGLDRITAIDEADLTSPENVDVLNNYIETEKRNGLLGYIRFKVNGDNTNDLIEDNLVEMSSGPDQVLGCLPDNTPNPTIRFENRKTFWRYIQLTTDDVFETKRKQPLTQKGFIDLRPNDLRPRLRNVFLLNPGKSGVRIEDDKIYSEIFI
ncbi:hypothetical protein [Aquimarina sp. AU474]|uniref:hypothetical protein n=1 Tax=Aquimarina sp. AU474 TaxID=2108529 RepID=UPI000D69F22F|nr:hypothetical protein [Aquimarina sp. AU474]